LIDKPAFMLVFCFIIRIIFKKGFTMRLPTTIMMSVALSACSNIDRENGAPQWDFDHKLQFEQTKLSENKYHLRVSPKSDIHFDQLATFMMRQSYKVCGTYGFTIKVLKGIEKFEDRRSLPNLMMPSLSANIECPSK
jgi:hypothetical protein